MRWLFLFWLVPLAALSDERLEVDVELFLAVDLSLSMSPAEIEIQRRGYAEALASDEVWGAINGGLIGRVAITYVEWAGERAQRVVIPWTLIDGPEDAAAIGEVILSQFSNGMRRTSISGVLEYALSSIERNEFKGLRRVIDVSGDGPNNQGLPVNRARDIVLSKGIIINGLPLMTKDEMSRFWDIDDLDDYYRRCVIGGPGAFVIPVFDWSQFAGAVKQKLVLEISGLSERVWRTQATSQGDYDCMIGEKMWERNRPIFDLP